MKGCAGFVELPAQFFLALPGLIELLAQSGLTFRGGLALVGADKIMQPPSEALRRIER